MTRRPFVAIQALVMAAAITSAPPEARAADTATTGAAAGLFDEGVALMAKGKYGEACPKLARSRELAPTGGTLLALGDCYDKNGQYASAWLAYKDAADRANAARRFDAEKAALEAARKLEPKIGKVVVEVSQRAEVEGLVIKRDGRSVSRAEWGIAVPLDPGTHTIEASAPGRTPWSEKVIVGTTASQKRLAVPLLAPVPAADVASKPGESRGGGQRVVGVVLAGVGVLGVGAGAYFGLRASSKNDQAAAHCHDLTVCDPQGLDLDKQARDAAMFSTIGFIAGGALLVGGVVLYLSAPSSRAPSATVGLLPRSDGGSVSFGSAF